MQWPLESAPTRNPSSAKFSQADGNQVLDFHGDPVAAEFCLLSDGNHHMALVEAVDAFAAAEVELGEVFYVTLPPPALRKILQAGSVSVGNLQFPVKPHMLISPAAVLAELAATAQCQSPQPFIAGRGYAWLVAKSNPKRINSIADLLRPDVRLFMSHPEREKVSQQNYCSAIMTMGGAADAGMLEALQHKLEDRRQTVYGDCIHHREAPESIAQGVSDIALLYYHLALRYVRVFPQHFDMLLPPELEALNRGLNPAEHQIHMAVVGNGGMWGQRALQFFQGRQVADIYQRHGLTALANTAPVDNV